MKTSTLPISLDQNIIDQIATEFDLRPPNKEGLRKLIFELTGRFDPQQPLVLDMATGSGKTFLMAAAVEYFRRQGLRNIMVITPSLVVQNKTVQNFSEGSRRYVHGFDVPPSVVSPQAYHEWRMRQTALARHDSTEPSMVFIFNVQQLISPKKTDKSKTGTTEATRTKIRKFQEDSGSLYDYLTELDDLIVIADESHLYGTSAKAFSQALKDLDPAATIGLTASKSKNDKVIYSYPLYQAIKDGHVKSPVLAYRKSGYPVGVEGERRQLRDALSLLRNKELAYQQYIHDNPGVPRTKPALFVVCANVDHATETAELLRGPSYCDDAEAVLQVDNEHDDERTRKYLDELDSRDSRVRVVVSVDKLKEGWDTKRIAVMCTLRAMASNVLTQQTMGRGLRLPFGKRTGISQIDQLDILAHTSFEELLNNEDILRAFGLDGAIEGGASGRDLLENKSRAGGTGDVANDDDLQPSNEAFEDGDDSTGVDPEGSPGFPSEHTTGSQPPVGVIELDDDEPIKEVVPPKPVTIGINPQFAGTTFLFPSTSMVKTTDPYDLSELDSEQVKDAAKRVTDTGDVLQRKKLIADEQKRSIKVQRTDDANVASSPVELEKVKVELSRRLLGLQQLTQTEGNIAQIKSRIVPEFVKAVSFAAWTEKAKDSALVELEELVRSEIAKHASRTKTKTVVHPVELPVDQSFDLPLGEDVLELLNESQKSEFQLRRYYGDWEKGLFKAASFDSWSAEYLIAMKLNYSAEIKWWKRLYRSDKASIAYSTRDNYYPDFVALDTSGVYWIIEGKSDQGRDDNIVKAKRDAAKSLVNKLISEPNFKDSGWGYLIAYETDVRRAEAWSDLKRRSSPTVTTGYGAE